MRRSTLALRTSSLALAAGFVLCGVANAAPAGAGESMKTDLHKLRLCESGGNYHENTGNGYYGAYQFAPTTWHALGFAGRPDRARHTVQNRAAKKLHHQAGWSSWPSCARSEHLR